MTGRGATVVERGGRRGPALVLTAALAVAVTMAWAARPAQAGSVDGWEAQNTPATAFKVQDLEGRWLDSRTLAGKVVLIDFWATWCVPCVQELPELEAYKQRIAGRQTLAVLSLNATEDLETVRAFVKRRGLRPPVYLGDDLLEPYHVAGFPTKVILDLRGGAPGKVRFRREGGPVSMRSLEERLEAVLAGRP